MDYPNPENLENPIKKRKRKIESYEKLHIKEC
jgi:hypothetical protein